MKEWTSSDECVVNDYNVRNLKIPIRRWGTKGRNLKTFNKVQSSSSQLYNFIKVNCRTLSASASSSIKVPSSRAPTSKHQHQDIKRAAQPTLQHTYLDGVYGWSWRPMAWVSGLHCTAEGCLPKVYPSGGAYIIICDRGACVRAAPAILVFNSCALLLDII